MALEEFVGAVALEFDGREFDCTSFSASVATGRSLVRTMNRSGRAAGYRKGITQYDLSITVVIPADGSEPDWENMVGAKLSVEPIAGGQREAYLDVFTTSVGAAYEMDGEARRNISAHALRKVKE